MATPLGKLAFAWTIAMVNKFLYFRYFPCDSNNETSEGLLSGRRITKEESRQKVVAAMRFLADSIRAPHLGLDSLAKNIEDQYRSYHIRIDEAEATRWFGPRPQPTDTPAAEPSKSNQWSPPQESCSPDNTYCDRAET